MAEWISVKDRLPPYNTYVLVYRPTMAIKILVDEYFGFYSDNGDEWFEGWAKFGKDLQGNPQMVGIVGVMKLRKIKKLST